MKRSSLFVLSTGILSLVLAAPARAAERSQQPVTDAPVTSPVPAPVFAPYILMSTKADADVRGIQQRSMIKFFTLAFIASGSSNGCTPVWGSLNEPIASDKLSNGTTILSQVQAVRAAGGDVIISFGGYAADSSGRDLAQACTDATSLQAAYQSVVDRYRVRMLDFDIEDIAVTDQASITRRDQALTALKAANPGLIISYTLPVRPTGLVKSGVNVLKSVKADGLQLDMVNVMAMEYGPSHNNGGQMGQNAVDAAGNTHNQILAAGLTAAVGVTPKIGVNGVGTEIFTFDDARMLVSFAYSNSYITRLSFWSVGRDNGNCADGSNSSTCSGIAQSPYQFSHIFEMPPTAAATAISGRVTTLNGDSLAGVTMTVSGGAGSGVTVTDGRGFYSFTGLKPGDFYTVSPSLANYSFSPGDRSFSLDADVPDAGFTGSPDAVPTANAIDTVEFFVRQHYLDFLGREPDQGGLSYWSDQLGACDGDGSCLNRRRTEVSAAFFTSPEFNDTGYAVYLLYRSAFGRRPTFSEFQPDRSRLIGGADLADSKQALLAEFVGRDSFKAVYPDSLSAADFVNQLYDSADLRPFTQERQAAINSLSNGASRASVLRGVIETAALKQREYNPAFVLMQYFGYLRRDPDEGGYLFWLNVLENRDANNFKGMVCAFITSREYQQRFSPVVTRSNADCGGPQTGPRAIKFGGHEWVVKSNGGRVGPGPNYFTDSSDNVEVDAQGRLHLRITQRDGRWYCAELISKESFGYGTYRFYLDTVVDNLDPQVVLGMFTYNDRPAYSHREIDIEISRWQNPLNENGQFVLQSGAPPENKVRFQIPGGLPATTHSFTWGPESILCQSLKGHSDPPASSSVIQQHTFVKGIPPADDQTKARINLWLVGGHPPANGSEVEVVISNFEFEALR